MLAPRGGRFFHGAPIVSVAFSRDRRVMVSASARMLKSWFARSGECVGTIAMREGELLLDAIAVSADGAHVWAYVSDRESPGGRLRSWEIDSLAPAREIGLASHTVFAFDDACSRALAGTGLELDVVELASGEITRLARRLHRVDGAAISGDGRFVAAYANADRAAPQVFVWRVEDGEAVRSIVMPMSEEGQSMATSIALSENGSHLAVGSYFGGANVVELETGHYVARVSSGRGPTTAVRFVDDRRFVTANPQRLLLWKLGEEKREQFFHCPRHARAVALDSTRTLLASGHHDGTLRLWDLAAGTFAAMPVLRREEATPSGPVTGVAFASPTRALVASGRRVIAWDVETGATFVVGAAEGTMSLVSAAGRVFLPHGELVGDEVVHRTEDRILDVSADGGRLLLGGRSRMAIVESATGETLVEAEVPERWARASLARAGGRFAIAMGNEVVLVDGSRRYERPWDDGAITALALDRTGELALVGTDGGMLAALDPRTGRIAWSVRTERPVHVIAVSPDGRMGAIGHEGQGGNLLVFEVATHRRVDRLAGHTWDVLSLAFSADGRTLLSGGRDRTARAWRVG